jgi:hypothetical protein
MIPGTSAVLNARVRPIGRTVVDAGDLVLVVLAKLAPHHLVAPRRFFSPCRGRVRLPLHRRRTRPPREQGRRGCAEAVRAVVAAGGSIATHDPQRLVPACCRTLARHRHWTSSRSRISVARSALSASASRAHDKDPPLTARYHVRPIPPGIRVSAGFDSGLGDCGGPEWHGRACRRGACRFIFAS